MRVRPSWLPSLAPLVLADLRRRYAGSFLGVLWAVAAPLLEASAYALVFGWLLGAAGSEQPYAILIASGLFPWIAVRETLEGSASVLQDNRWIRRSRVPVELMVARLVVAAQVRACVGVLVVLVFAAITGRTPGLLGWMAPFAALAIQGAGVYGLGLVVAPAATLLPDLRPTLTWLLTLLTFASPILYPESLARGPLGAVVAASPFTYLLRLYRAPAMPSDATVLLGSLVVSSGAALAVLLLGRGLSPRLFWKARDLL